MALKPTIYKFKLSVSDLNHDYFDSLNLTVALHPSETKERMMVRVLVFCLHAYQDHENLMAFTKGLSAIDEPDIWLRGLDDQLYLWVDVGEPSFERIKKVVAWQNKLMCTVLIQNPVPGGNNHKHNLVPCR
ncbi:hypothetical protein C427_3780 [Paraglaciecola psychrophila 170]|uniref:YaeQ family protein n=1 Tax=Paraglaciecola psychrophila 170 TaxID=1129794 RepID=M4RTA4_9ALTE|nr:hypothetical protein C427_3780 [Paraglaciecola psychrophila 170]